VISFIEGYSLPSNIGEGFELNTQKQCISFLSYAKGSAAELRTQIYIAQKIGVISLEVSKELTDELKTISSMLHGSAKSLNT